MGLRDEHVEALVEEKVAEFAGILSPAQLAELRGILRDACDVHPEVRELVDEHAPREHQDISGPQPIDHDAIAEADRKKSHG